MLWINETELGTRTTYDSSKMEINLIVHPNSIDWVTDQLKRQQQQFQHDGPISSFDICDEDRYIDYIGCYVVKAEFNSTDCTSDAMEVLLTVSYGGISITN